MKKFKNALTSLSMLFLLSSVLFSCKTKELLPLPSYPSLHSLPPVVATVNTYEYSIQPMDEDAKCDNSTLTAFYDGFNVIYSMNENRVMKFCIENKTNKYLILDKSKCYVIYDGYSRELFKDVRSGRSTTYNNVQDAINSVSTNESSITLSIPPYSKWELPIEETNVESVKICDEFLMAKGSHPLTPYTTNQTIEFVIPYSWDYSLSKWDTSRNRLYVGNIKVEEVECASPDMCYNLAVFSGNCYSKAMVAKDGRREYDLVVAKNTQILNEYSLAKDEIRKQNDEIIKKNLNAEINNEIFKIFGIAFGVPAGIGLLVGLILSIVL